MILVCQILRQEASPISDSRIIVERQPVAGYVVERKSCLTFSVPFLGTYMSSDGLS